MKSYWTLLLALAPILSIGCNAPRNQNVTSGQSNPTLASPSIGVCGEMLRDAPDGLHKRWDGILADGNYRLAQASDFKLPNGQHPWPCHFGWSGELFAILIDTTQTDNSRFKLALFVPSKNGQGSYELYWVLHNHDLSRSILSNASSNLVVYEYLDGGGTRNSTLKWDKTKKAYVSIVA